MLLCGRCLYILDMSLLCDICTEHIFSLLYGLPTWFLKDIFFFFKRLVFNTSRPRNCCLPQGCKDILLLLVLSSSKYRIAEAGFHRSSSQRPLFIGRWEKAMAPHSSTLAWKIPWTEEPGRLQSMGSLIVGHDWATSLSLSCIGEGNGNPLQCSCLENPRDEGACWAAVCGVAQSRTRLKRLSSSLVFWDALCDSVIIFS